MRHQKVSKFWGLYKHGLNVSQTGSKQIPARSRSSADKLDEILSKTTLESTRKRI